MGVLSTLRKGGLNPDTKELVGWLVQRGILEAGSSPFNPFNQSSRLLGKLWKPEFLEDEIGLGGFVENAKGLVIDHDQR